MFYLRTSPGMNTYEKMSKISEEEYQIENLTPISSVKKRESNANLTTNEHIEHFMNSLKHTNSKTKSPSNNFPYGSDRVQKKVTSRADDEYFILEEKDNSHKYSSELDQSLSVRKGRFNVKIIPNDLKNEYRDEPKPLPFSNINEAYQPYLVFPTLEPRTSSEYNFGYLQVQPHNSNTEYSLRDRSEAGTARNFHTFVPEFGQNLQANNDDPSQFYPYRSDNLKTPMFTNGSSVSQQNMFQNRQVPPISFEQINELRQDEHDYEIDTLNSMGYSEKEDKGSPRNSSYFIEERHTQEQEKRMLFHKRVSMHSQQMQTNPMQNQMPSPMNQNFHYMGPIMPQIGENQMIPYNRDHQQMNTHAHYQSQMEMMSNTFRAMQEYQNMQFQCMLESHTKIMSTMIDKISDASV